MKTIEDIARNLLVKSNEPIETFNKHESFIQLLTALHDAINSPKGVVPKSAEDFYCSNYYEINK